jgi:hypothetical protein
MPERIDYRARIRYLAQFIHDKKARGRKFVVMLGAGASLSSGIKPTNALIEDLVARHPGLPGDTVEERFDALWKQSNRDDRATMLAPYLRQGTPSLGYRQLADLIARDYFDLVVTFNYDQLVKRALDEAGFSDYHQIIRGETAADEMARLLENPEPRVKILKLHGSLESADYFLFRREETVNYPTDLEELVRGITGRDIIVCGYAFNDICMIKAFNASRDAGSIYFVNPNGARENNILGFLAARLSTDKVIAGELGRFDEFFDELHKQLIAPASAVMPGVRHNLFKFLDGYREGDRSWFVGRRRLTWKLLAQLDADPRRPAKPGFVPFRVLWLGGKPKVGKSSLVRAGLLAHLDSSRWEPIYLRCTRGAEPEAQLRAELERHFSTPFAGLDGAAMLSRAVELTPKRLMVVIDQFERPCRAAEASDERLAALLAFVNTLIERAGERMTVVFVGSGEEFWTMSSRAAPHVKATEVIPPLSAARVARIIRYAARQGGVTLEPDAVAGLCDRYHSSLKQKDPEFTLMHVQTICYYLARGDFRGRWEGPENSPPSLAAALDSIKDEANLLEVLDDLPADERRVIRSFLKVICDPSTDTRKVIDFIRVHFPDMREERFPEPIAAPEPLQEAAA